MTPPPNPPAFPIGETHFAQSDRHGMTLRDWFAGQALPETMRLGLMLNCSLRDVAEDAYEMADAMLAERARTTGEDTTA